MEDVGHAKLCAHTASWMSSCSSSGCGVVIKGFHRDRWDDVSEIAVPFKKECSALAAEIVYTDRSCGFDAAGAFDSEELNNVQFNVTVIRIVHNLVNGS